MPKPSRSLTRFAAAGALVILAVVFGGASVTPLRAQLLAGPTVDVPGGPTLDTSKGNPGHNDFRQRPPATPSASASPLTSRASPTLTSVRPAAARSRFKAALSDPCSRSSMPR